MGERGVGVFGQIAFHLAPIIFVVADLFAIGANGQESPEALDLSHGLGEVLDPVGQALLNRQNAHAPLQCAPTTRPRGTVL